MIDHTKIKLGKHPARFDERTLNITKYLTPGLMPPPSIVDWTPPGINWGMMGNDKAGDCTWAGFGHGIQLWTGNNGSIITPSDADVTGEYWSMTGGKDTGCNELDVLNSMTRTGLSGHRIQAYASIEAGGSQLDLPTMNQTVFLLGFSYIGIQLPSAWQGKDVWDVYGPLSSYQNQPGSWGGHCVIIVAYIDDNGVTQYRAVTWGAEVSVTDQAMEAYIDEAYGVVSTDWVDSDKLAPNCINLSALTADAELLRAA